MEIFQDNSTLHCIADITWHLPDNRLLKNCQKTDMAFYDVCICNKSFVYKLIFHAFSPVKYVSHAVGYPSQWVFYSATILLLYLNFPAPANFNHWFVQTSIWLFSFKVCNQCTVRAILSTVTCIEVLTISFISVQTTGKLSPGTAPAHKRHCVLRSVSRTIFLFWCTRSLIVGFQTWLSLHLCRPWSSGKICLVHSACLCVWFWIRNNKSVHEMRALENFYPWAWPMNGYSCVVRLKWKYAGVI